MKTMTANATAASVTSRPTSRAGWRGLTGTALALRIGRGADLVAGGVEDVVLTQQVIAGGVGLGDGADQLGLQHPVVSVDGGDARLRVGVDEAERAVELRQ